MSFVTVYTFDRVVNQLIAGLKVAPPVDPGSVFNPNDVQNALIRKALWDTGATNTCISERLAKELDLPLIGVTTTQTAGGAFESNTYACCLIGLQSSKYAKTVVNKRQ